MKVAEQHVAQAVKEASEGAEDQQHVAAVVGAFMQRQPMIGHYVQAYTREIGLEGMVLTLLHASVLARAVEIARGKKLPQVKARALDGAASAPGSGEKVLAEEEPELIGYLAANLSPDDPNLGGAKRTTALGILRVVARALLDT